MEKNNKVNFFKRARLKYFLNFLDLFKKIFENIFERSTLYKLSR